jgi:NAD(P)-dependent dehydrogenase (short-subunit alcohol dehydrogenase family)
VELLELDLASFASIRRAAAEVLERHERLHVLVNNAGLILGDRRLTEDGLEMTLGVNHFGPFLFTQLLRQRIVDSAPARIVNVSSEAHQGAKSMRFDDLQSERRYTSWDAYNRSKLANILFTAELAEQLEGSGVTANCLHPGVVRSGFARDGDTGGLLGMLVVLGGPFLLSPKVGARTSIYLASSPEVEGVSGRYFKRKKPVEPSRAARDREEQKKLWTVSEELTGAPASQC